MTLAPGSALGPYDILGALGRGGMGEVYRAHDSHLDREVALKFLAESARDPEQLERFRGEVRTARRRTSVFWRLVQGPAWRRR